MSAKTTQSPEIKAAPEKWYRVLDAAAITKLSRTTLYGEMSAGRLKSVKVGGSRRISESSLAAWQASFDGSGEVVGS